MLGELKKNMLTYLGIGASVAGVLSKEVVGKHLVADFTPEQAQKMAQGTWKLMQRDSGELMGTLVNAQGGGIAAKVNLKEMVLTAPKSNPYVMAALVTVQLALKEINQKIEEVSKALARIEIGQYNDRFAGFLSARQQMAEAMRVSDPQIRQELLINAIKTANDSTAQLQFAIYTDANYLMVEKPRGKERDNRRDLLEKSIGYLNASAQLIASAYIAMGEAPAVVAVLKNHQEFFKQVFIDREIQGWSLARYLDNAESSNSRVWSSLAFNIIESIDGALQNPALESQMTKTNVASVEA
ncbi:MAG: hypothetical protein Q4P78_02590 [Rothia sp. (in: high G+C Gram-positive bacteria)]|uniref:hypothetical protein n=1 Tax=Rothia sp. (in: high G+C Gram-positive bacteria) TaxID=1885016 RepID=UPI0026DFC1AD|nr:hypothetical protein [Rothia sp. (in: high G+C Gram-positive bacteria)]MDO5750076.1 hypothetical protein [Rothia sp. (in: high G+C Gram-positive bacteria)]